MSEQAPTAEVTVDELAQALADGHPLIDVREEDEYAEAHVPGAVLIPLSSLNARAGDIPTDTKVYVICRSGSRSLTASTALNRAGWDTVSVAGGTLAWMESGRHVDTGGGSGG